MRSVIVLLAFFAAVAAAASFGAIYMPGAWYAALAKPSWTPPNSWFPVAWTILYVMIALAGWFAWRTEGWSALVGFWIAQLLVNASWSWVMFGQHWIFAALLVLSALWLLVVAFTLRAWRSARPAALLFMPYLAWVSFAWTLNAGVWWLNR